jgi:hypothetical protein
MLLPNNKPVTLPMSGFNVDANDNEIVQHVLTQNASKPRVYIELTV